MEKILIVEDDSLLNKTLEFNLISEGYETGSAHTCREARRLLEQTAFDLILLDINLPDGSGIGLCEGLRQAGNQTCVIFLTANDRESDQLRGYEAGGFDYITKPFSIAVLCRKLSALFAQKKQTAAPSDRYDDGFLSMDFSGQTSTLNGAPLELTPKEYQMLRMFVQNPNRILTKTQLLEKLWDESGSFVDEHTLATVVSRIRKKIETDSRKYIKTAYGMGYQWIGGKQDG